MKQRLPYIIVLIVQAVLFFIVKDDPFFGDAISSTVRATMNIYEHHLATVFYPIEHDPRHPTLYSWLLAACWLAFGKSLWVSHLYSCLWAFALAVVFLKTAEIFLTPFMRVCAAILLCCFATYLSQSAMMLNTAAFMTMTLLVFYGFFTQKKPFQIIGLTLMMCLHTQSVFFLIGFAAANFIDEVFFKKQSFAKWFRNAFTVFALPAVVCCAWLWLHWIHTGWLVHSPNYTDTHELNLSVSFLRSLGIIAWRLIDYGMLPFYMLLAWIVFRHRKKLHQSHIFTGIVLLVNIFFMALFLKDTIGHRYFLVFQLLIILFSLFHLQTFKPLYKYIWLCVFALSLFFSNWLYYPGKTLGDATLAYRNYFKIEEQIRQQFGDTLDIYSYAPVANPPELKYLFNNALNIHRIAEDDIAAYPVILESNVNAEFTQEQLAQLQQWYGTSFERGAVYVNLFFNPAYYPPNPNWKLREEGKFEKWMKEMKK